MWQRFTERARRIVFFAQEEAGKLGDNDVSTEHLLLGLVRENNCVAARVLERIGVSRDQIRDEVERQVERNDEGRLGEDMQLTPLAKRVIDLAFDEARMLNNNYIGTEHLLLGLVREGEGLVGRREGEGVPSPREGEGVAGRVLLELGVNLDRARREVKALQGTHWGREDATEPRTGSGHQSQGQDLLAHLRQLVRMWREADPKAAELTDAEMGSILLGHAEPNAEPEDIAPAPGDLGTLCAAEGRDRVEVAQSPADFEALMDVCTARDAHGYHELTGDSEHAAARVLLLKAGTEVKALVTPRDAGEGDLRRALHVRILSGTYVGKTGWIHRESFERTGPDTTPFPPTASE